MDHQFQSGSCPKRLTDTKQLSASLTGVPQTGGNTFIGRGTDGLLRFAVPGLDTVRRYADGCAGCDGSTCYAVCLMTTAASHTQKGGPGERVSIVVPTYREAENLPALVRRIHAAMASSVAAYEIVVVDDDSRDGTDRVIADLAAANHPVRLITRVGERGLSSAVLRGFHEARGQILVCMDADLSHPPEVVPRLLACLAEPAVDFALASRYVPGGSTDDRWGLLRWINSKAAALLARPFVNVRDPMSGFFALRRSVLSRAAELSPVGYKIGLELMVKCSCRHIREVPIHFALREHGRSKLTLTEQINYLRHIQRLAAHKLRAAL